MNSFIKYICVFCGGIGLLTSTTACTNLDEETFPRSLKVRISMRQVMRPKLSEARMRT